MKVHVSNIDQLYAAVDATTNAGNEIVLSTGTYVLDATKGINSGRLELQEDMMLTGKPGNAGSVVIDASGLKDASFFPANNFPARTGAIRIGRGFNKIEWLKVIGTDAPRALSVVDSDLFSPGVTRIRIAHCIITKGRIGINIRNIGVPSINRVIEVELAANELTDNKVSDVGTRQGQGIVIQSANGASNATIQATLHGNNVHDNILGMRVFNNSANSSTDSNSIVISSHADKFDNNELMGIYMAGGFSRSANSTVNKNFVSLEAHGSSIQNNRGIGSDKISPTCGIFLSGGASMVANGDTSNNKAVLKLIGCKISGNTGSDIVALGALSTTAAVEGTDNLVEIHLQGVSKNATVLPDDSSPYETAGTNKVIIHK